MKNIGILILGLSVFVSVGCSGSKQVPDQKRDSAADVYEIGEVSPLEEEPKKARKSWRKKKQKQEVAIKEKQQQSLGFMPYVLVFGNWVLESYFLRGVL